MWLSSARSRWQRDLLHSLGSRSFGVGSEPTQRYMQEKTVQHHMHTHTHVFNSLHHSRLSVCKVFVVASGAFSVSPIPHPHSYHKLTFFHYPHPHANLPSHTCSQVKNALKSLDLTTMHKRIVVKNSQSIHLIDVHVHTHSHAHDQEGACAVHPSRISHDVQLHTCPWPWPRRVM